LSGKDYETHEEVGKDIEGLIGKSEEGSLLGKTRHRK
jgi:hypothetical protein